MQTITTENVTNALPLLAEAAADHHNEITKHDNTPVCPDSDDETDSQSPVFDKFHNDGGAGAILKMTNFGPSKCEYVWQGIEEKVNVTFLSGRGKKSAVKPKDCLFIFLTVLKHGGQWDFLGRMFNCKGPNFERIMLKFCSVVSPLLYQKIFEQFEKVQRFGRLNDAIRVFCHHPTARYATDVCFQQSNRPSGTMKEAQPWYSGKYRLHGFKFEASVFPIGMCISCSKHAREGRADLEILQSRAKVHEYMLKKRGNEIELEDNEEGNDEYETMWAVLVDKRYQGIKEFLRSVHPVRKPVNRILSSTENRYNAKVSSDRIIVENYFGRMISLRNVLSHKWRWSEEIYDIILFCCVALTNFHIKDNPLRAVDGEFYQQDKNRLFEAGVSNSEKRRETQKRYREKRRRKMNIRFRALDGDEH